ncbi:uncharacterized protein H6S33_003985 [Morchella sextelata]|uniref:uncharacterized protein n=1 Tax=Morchella sextelata TaxID=1174677 RepID=UPI001D04771C|nr:uncharacterized protein H6S33_003985 [Morchella sextelata]KAH0606324.1 hypothetical protein H6S33_003985 [Morchella sextelata]
MQFSTIFSIATLVAAVAAAPSCNSPTQQNACAARTDGHNVAACCTMLHAGGKEICQSIASIGICTAAAGSVTTVKCCNVSSGEQKGLVNIAAPLCVL